MVTCACFSAVALLFFSCVGFVLGSFLGVIMLIWLWQPRGSRRQKLGMLSPVCLHIVVHTVCIGKLRPIDRLQKFVALCVGVCVCVRACVGGVVVVEAW